MKQINERQFVHDGRIFHYTPEAIEDERNVIGFYFDDFGYPQAVYRNSIYGNRIMDRYNNEENKKGEFLFYSAVRAGSIKEDIANFVDKIKNSGGTDASKAD